MYTIEEYKTLLKALKLYGDVLESLHSEDVDELGRAESLKCLMAEKLTILECDDKSFSGNMHVMKDIED